VPNEAAKMIKILYDGPRGNDRALKSEPLPESGSLLARAAPSANFNPERFSQIN